LTVVFYSTGLLDSERIPKLLHRVNRILHHEGLLILRSVQQDQIPRRRVLFCQQSGVLLPARDLLGDLRVDLVLLLELVHYRDFIPQVQFGSDGQPGVPVDPHPHDRAVRVSELLQRHHFFNRNLVLLPRHFLQPAGLPEYPSLGRSFIRYQLGLHRDHADAQLQERILHQVY